MNTEEFQSTFLGNAELPVGNDPIGLFNEYVASRNESLTQAKNLGVGSAGLTELRQRMTRAFVRRWMMLRYAAIDLSFTSRSWWITAQRDGGSARIISASDTQPHACDDRITTVCGEISRFFHVSQSAKPFAFNKTGNWGEEKMSDPSQVVGEFMHGQRNKVSYRSLRVSVRASVPDGIRQHHRDLVLGAIGHFNLAIAIGFTKGIDVYDEMQLERNERGLVKIIWAPLLEALTLEVTPPRPVGDPAVVYTLGEDSYLLDFYDTPDESPIEHLIREFSEGRLAR